MPSNINLSTVSFDGKEVMSLREAFYQAVFQNPTIDQFHTVVNGIKAKQQMIYLGQFGLTGKAQTSCDITATTATVPAVEKFWDPKYIGDRIEECFTDLLQTFFVWGLKNGVQKPDLTNTDFALFLEERFSLAAYETALRFAWLGDTAADIATNGGYLSNSVDPAYFNVFNGFWAQAKGIVANDATKKVAIPNNAGTSFAAQAFTSTDTSNNLVTNIFQNMIYGADLRLRGAKDKVIIATQSVVDQYARERKAVNNIELAYERTESGIDTFKVDGIDVIPFQFLDRHIKAYESNGTKWNQPHRILFTTKGNLQIGTEETSNLSELEPFYDKKSKKYCVDYGFNLDAKIAEDYLTMVAY
ncbi:hypothetical protein BEL04_14550 [Mucilaginibacter sp. PPCGB 2223]|uniref:hypothetical protein n=1 Tax=Mucilaginibacter sp. PPCGB 2223 TaxID=1886027 RepID=UPI00082511E5|nr:hypothetical protein [Mucilaginibacter sp. PPCGB 2223]OCX52663.1 hypothetical protein BEL04_14550 [Mucilaginibacter sp. PPCGB 2223]